MEITKQLIGDAKFVMVHHQLVLLTTTAVKKTNGFFFCKKTIYISEFDYWNLLVSWLLQC